MKPSGLDLGTGDWAEKEKEQLAIKGIERPENYSGISK